MTPFALGTAVGFAAALGVAMLVGYALDVFDAETEADAWGDPISGPIQGRSRLTTAPTNGARTGF